MIDFSRNGDRMLKTVRCNYDILKPRRFTESMIAEIIDYIGARQN